MRIDLRLKPNETAFGVVVDPAKPPTVLKPRGPKGPTVTLNWDRALDDQKHLRQCPVCGCPDLFKRKKVPQLTSFVVIVFAAVVAMILFGLQMVWPAIITFAVLAAIDIGIYLFAPRILECYRCHSVYRLLPIRRGHPRWDKTLAEKYRREQPWTAPTTLPPAPNGKTAT